MITAALRWLAMLAALLATPAMAHLSPNSVVSLDFGDRRVAAEIVIPLGELDYARGPGAGPVAAYLLDRIGAAAPDGRRWGVTLDRLGVTRDTAAPDLIAKLTLRPPNGADARHFTLRYAAVIDAIPNHFVLVLARSDYAGGHLATAPRMIGGLQKGVTTLRVDRGEGSAWRGFTAAMRLGIEHIAEGHDHLLFLIALILPAPLIAAGGRWRRYGGARHMLRTLVGVVTAFTIGHSITLIGGAFFGWRLPAQPVELLIALSILISAIHALRPLFPGREAFVAGGFGLVHGLAFATVIGDFGLEPLQKAQSILGFNLGIEIVQLGVIACVTPSLLIFAPTPAYAPLRTIGAGLAGIAATAWIVERALATRNPVAAAIDRGLSHAPWLIAALAIAALVAVARRRLPGQPLLSGR